LTELFPFHVRASGIAIYVWWNRSGGFIAQFLNPIGIDALGWKWYITYWIWSIFQVVFIYLMLPETSGRTLEELTFLFEEDREVLSRASEPLCGHGGNETYCTMEDHRHPGRPIGDEPLP